CESRFQTGRRPKRTSIARPSRLSGQACRRPDFHHGLLRYASMWILRSAETETTFRLRSGAVKTVGRAPRADFVVHAALFSRLHCRLTATDDKLDVGDLMSTNGMFV